MVEIIAKLFLILLLVVLVVTGGQALAYVASSTNYRLERDSLNFAGGLSTSTNYGLEDTAGEIGTGLLSSTNYNLLAGYQQLDSSGSTLSISAPADINLSPDLPSRGGGEADGSASWTVTTTNPSGYSLTVAAASAPALAAGSENFADYVPAGAVPDFTFSVGPSNKVFAFTPEGLHLTSQFKDNGAICGTGSGDTASACWVGLSTTPQIIAQSAAATPGGTATTLRFKAAAGADASITPGNYSAAITLTATAL